MKILNKHIFFLPLILLIWAFLSFEMNAQDSNSEQSENRQLIYDKISINGASIDFSQENNLVMGEGDSVAFYYFCNFNGEEKTPFLFRTVLRNGQDSAVKVWNESVIQYTDLPKDDYEISIVAFDLQKNWETAPAIIKFRVNDHEVKLLKQIALLKNQLSSAAKELDSLKNIPPPDVPMLIDSLSADMESKTKSFNFVSAGVGLLFGGIIFVLVYFFVLGKKPKKEKDPEEDPVAKGIQNRMDDLEKEREIYQLEIDALRGQIEQMQVRSTEMQKENKSLEDSVLKITNSKDEIEELQAQKDELFAMLIHDIKNPAGIIKSLVELLVSYDLSAIEQQKIIEDIMSTTRRIMQLSSEVSRVLALESGDLRLDLSPSNIFYISQDVSRRYEVKAKEKAIFLLHEVPEDLPSVDIDSMKIDEVISNLLSNAIKFTQDGGTVRMKAMEKDDSLVMEISDNGQGLSEEDIKQAFQKGAQLSARPTAGETSTGLGLWIVKRLVEAHSGKVWVRSFVGKGSTFAFSLPQKANSTRS
jgi:signal transduction histidine kinase